MNPEDLINFNGLSVLLTGKSDIVRRNRIAKAHKAKVDELKALLEYFISKHKTTE